MNEFSPVHLGSVAENPVMLSPCEWADVFLDQGAQIRRGDKKNGVWHVFVERAGTYEISLRRWPIEADAAIIAGLPPYEADDGRYAEGVALPVAKARLKIADFEDSRPVSAADKGGEFQDEIAIRSDTVADVVLRRGGKRTLRRILCVCAQAVRSEEEKV